MVSVYGQSSCYAGEVERILTERRVVVIGASAGGIDALMKLVRGLPGDFPAPVLVVLHLAPEPRSILAAILARETDLEATEAVDGRRCSSGVIYTAQPDRHLLLEADGTMRVVHGPRENRHRPAIDPLFRSAALHFGRHAVGVVLSGTLDDGTAGLLAIKSCGGVAIVQDPESALYPAMPQSAIENVAVDHVVSVERMAAVLVDIVRAPAPARVAVEPYRALLRKETGVAKLDHDAVHDDDRPGHPSAYSCPDCGGVLWEIEDGDFLRYRCRVGHAFSPDTMLGAQDDVLEEALWTAAKTLEESARLAGRLAAGERSRGHEWMAKRFTEKEQKARAGVEVIRQFLLRDRGIDRTTGEHEGAEPS
jgi:two-component system, chemotaxis family, protein-glutamate methylesterase/glutaminase